MGLGASKELPVAQQQLKRLTEELRIAQKVPAATHGSRVLTARARLRQMFVGSVSSISDGI